MSKGILIVPLINKKEHGKIVQSNAYKISLKITNFYDSPSEEFDINSITLHSAEGQDIFEDFGKKSFVVERLNPGESKIIEVGKFGSPVYKLVNLRTTITPKTAGINIIFLQKNPLTKEIVEVGANTWVDFLYIISSSENELAAGTSAIVWFTVAIFIFTALQFAEIFYLQPENQLKATYEKFAQTDSFNFFIACQIKNALAQANYNFLVNYDTDVYTQNFDIVGNQPTSTRDAIETNVVLMEASNNMLNGLIQEPGYFNQYQPKLIGNANTIINDINSYNKTQETCNSSVSSSTSQT